MLSIDTSYLKNRKNLLAFSSGVDSSALFFILLENNIYFDIAIVNYDTREQSNNEVTHAKNLAKKYNLACHTIKAPKFNKHFEQNARNFRYAFFEKLIEQYKYENLLTAHQLNDQLEWLMMRLSKGAGVSELIGLEPVVQKEGYRLIRPLLSSTKAELLAYLEQHNHPYFIDESNSNTQYERNHFRTHFSDPLIERYAEGIRRSFAYLRQDKAMIESGITPLHTCKQLHILRVDTPALFPKAADLTLKKLGYLLSAAQRKEIEVCESLVVGRKWVVAKQEERLYICPHRTINMPKDFKERCRIAKIPAKIRPYLFEEGIDITTLPQ